MLLQYLKEKLYNKGNQSTSISATRRRAKGETNMQFVFSTGGREKYFKGENVGDCVTRAICNATGKDYKEVYDRLNEMAKRESVKRHRGHKHSQSRNGVFKETWKRYLQEIGWVHHKTCEIGSKENKVKLVQGQLPNGVLIVQLSKHLTCVKDQVIYDTYDCSKKQYYDEYGDLCVNEERCVYGYWTAPTEQEVKARQEQQEELAKIKAMEQQAIEETKAKVNAIKKQHKPTLKKLEKKLKDIKHQLVLETNRMKREIAKIKEQDGNAYVNKWLDHEEQRLVGCMASKGGKSNVKVSKKKLKRFTL